VGVKAAGETDPESSEGEFECKERFIRVVDAACGGLLSRRWRPVRPLRVGVGRVAPLSSVLLTLLLLLLLLLLLAPTTETETELGFTVDPSPLVAFDFDLDNSLVSSMRASYCFMGDLGVLSPERNMRLKLVEIDKDPLTGAL
jgi:hypothetical protein